VSCSCKNSTSGFDGGSIMQLGFKVKGEVSRGVKSVTYIGMNKEHID
jgi:hypothetical protein